MTKYYYARLQQYRLCQNQASKSKPSTVKKSPLLVFSLLLLASASSNAVSLGRYRGVALIGRSLDLSVQALLEAQDDVASLCIEADVFYGDNKLEKSRVRLSVEKAASAPQSTYIRVRSTSLIDEPIVSIYLRLGCRQKVEKRYVVLADVASDAVEQGAFPQISPGQDTPSVAAASGTANPSTGSSFSLALPPNGAAGGSKRSGFATSAPRQNFRALPSSPQSAQGDTPGASAPPAKTDSGLKESRVLAPRNPPSRKNVDRSNARLKLEPLDLSMTRDPALKVSSELLSTPSSNAQERSASAALWRTLIAQPQDILRDLEKLQVLENSIRALQIESRKNQLTIAELNAKVSKVEFERYANVFVYSLLALLLAALAALVYAFRRMANSRGDVQSDLPWWRRNATLENDWAISTPEAEISSFSGESRPVKNSVRKRTANRQTSVPLDLDLGSHARGSGSFEVEHPSSLGPLDSMLPLSGHDRPEFGLSTTHPARAVKAEELFDVQQQADFFVSLGQHEQAIEVLRNHIGDNVQTSALVYLDLFNLYYRLKRQDDYESLREEFNQRFNGNIPAFEFYNESGQGLESYQVALTRIEALWPSPKVLEVIEESIFRRPEAGSEAFDLEAYRELLLLYSVAREIISPATSARNNLLKFDLPAFVPSIGESSLPKFLATSIQPLSATVVSARNQQDSQSFLGSTLPPSSPRLGLDLDLSELGIEQHDPQASEINSDSRFFAQFAADIAISPPSSPALPPTHARAPNSSGYALPRDDNLIDFNTFDSLDDGFKLSTQPKPRPKR